MFFCSQVVENSIFAIKSNPDGMLVTFSVGNFLSFKDVQSLSLVADSLKEFESNLMSPYFYNPEEKLLKSIAIYGPNANGKTNFINAFRFLQTLIGQSFSSGQLNTKIDIEPFRLNVDSRKKPSLFEISFLIKETKYRYKIVLDSSTVYSEELHYSVAKVRENSLFERRGQEFRISKQWNKEADSRIELMIPFAKPHILFLSVLLSQAEIPRMTAVGNWLFSNLIIPDNYLLELSKARIIYSNPEYRSLILKFIENADLGFSTIFDKIESLHHKLLDKGFLNLLFDKEIKHFELYTSHNVYDDQRNIIEKEEFELLKNESAGSIKYFIIASLFAYSIKNSLLIWVDELDSKLHSHLLMMLVQSFHSPVINPMSSQLIFTTHNTILLEYMRRDQVVVIEKNNWGESSINKIHTPEKPVRIGKSLEKEYRKGNLGGVSKKIKGRDNPTLFD